ncbi:unnamed protein product [Adineta steineri]|uniref:Uncharacterized protein n=1 Tax=Adineta steineri TaxID=433720 RepID=A0A819VC78_9BILA|nr:unnamed protein product [Adineta steineri]CAF4106660.1 unnamed protein product [Adineta steineri]
MLPLLTALLLVVTGVTSRIHMHHTNNSTSSSNGRYNCIYTGRTSPYTNLIEPYCLSHNNEKSELCYGQELSFIFLKTLQIKTSDLLAWFTPIDVIDQYQVYLDTDDPSLRSGISCNCTEQSWTFGNRCQYKLPFAANGDYSPFDNDGNPRFIQMDKTCFKDIECDADCLDWRQTSIYRVLAIKP